MTRKNKKFRKFKKRRPGKSQDSRLISTTGAGSDGDRGAGYSPVSLFANKSLLGFGLEPYGIFYLLHRYFWEAKKMVDIPPSDMTREGWRYINPDLDPTVIAAVAEEEKRLNLVKIVNQALIFERLYGGSVILIGTSEINKDAKNPLEPEDIEKGGLVFLRALPRQDVTPVEAETNPLSRYYGQANIYTIGSHEVHRSRLLIFDGGGEKNYYGTTAVGLSNCGSRYDGFGNSILEPIFDDIVRCDGGRQAAFHLVNILSIPIFQQQAQSDNTLKVSRNDEYFIKRLKQISKQMSLYNAVILEPGVTLGNYTSKMSDLPAFVESQLKILSASADIPAPRFLGEAPGGLNATGKGELRNYYDGIHSEQELRLKPALNKLKPYLIKSATGKNYELIIEFCPLMQTGEDEAARIRGLDWKNVREAVQQGIGDLDWARKEVQERKIFLNAPAVMETESVSVLPTEKNNEVAKN